MSIKVFHCLCLFFGVGGGNCGDLHSPRALGDCNLDLGGAGIIS